MAITTLDSGSASSSRESFAWSLDYDSTARAIGLTCTGSGHAQLTLVNYANQATLGSVWCDQFGSTAGPIAGAGSVNVGGFANAGESATPVTYDGTRHIVVGPGAVGIQPDGTALPTQSVPQSVIGAFNLKTPTIGIYLTWTG